MKRNMIIGAIAAAVLIVAPAAGASAGTQTVVQAIKAQDKIVKASGSLQSLSSLKIKSAAEAEKAIPKYEKAQKVLENAATAVSHASATPGQKAGQKDWVTGVRTVATAFGYLVTALRDLIDNHSAAGVALANKAKTLSLSGAKIGAKGDRLLGLPAGA